MTAADARLYVFSAIIKKSLEHTQPEALAYMPIAEGDALHFWQFKATNHPHETNKELLHVQEGNAVNTVHLGHKCDLEREFQATSYLSTDDWGGYDL